MSQARANLAEHPQKPRDPVPFHYMEVFCLQVRNSSIRYPGFGEVPRPACSPGRAAAFDRGS